MLLEENVRRAACLINSFSLQRRHRDVNGCSCGSLPFGPPALCAVFFHVALQWGFREAWQSFCIGLPGGFLVLS